MKKIFTTALLYIVLHFSACICSHKEVSTTYWKIFSVKSALFSLNENGISPFYDRYDRQELVISIMPDSLIKRIETAYNYSPVNNAYACQDPDRVEYENFINSLNVTTVYDFDDNYPAGSNINDLLLTMDIMGGTKKVDINELQIIELTLKFSKPPTYDSLQFTITGRIGEDKDFSNQTDLVIL